MYPNARRAVDVMLQYLERERARPAPRTLTEAIQRGIADAEAADEDGWIDITPRQRSSLKQWLQSWLRKP